MELEKKENWKFNYQTLSICDLLHNVVEDTSKSELLRAKNVSIEITDDAPYFFDGDGKSIVQLLTNVLINAIKFSPKDGKIEVTVTDFYGITKSRGLETNFIRLSFKDQGPGIPESKIHDIFEPFTQVHEDDGARGNGLGLSICKKICEHHMGRIWATSKVGEGSTFHILLPAAQHNVGYPVEKQDRDSEIFFLAGKKRILIVDDQVSVRLLTTQALQKMGFDTYPAASGTDALCALQRGRFDLILLDINMPGISGLQFMDFFYKQGFETPIFLFSLLSAGKVFQQCYEKAQGSLQKPLNIREFTSKMRAFMGWDFTSDWTQTQSLGAALCEGADLSLQ